MAHRDTFVEAVVALDNSACIVSSDLPALCSGSKAAFSLATFEGFPPGNPALVDDFACSRASVDTD